MTPPPLPRSGLRAYVRRTGLRWLVLGAAVGVAVTAGAGGAAARGGTWTTALAEHGAAVVLPALSPFLALGGALVSRAASPVLLLGLATLVWIWWVPRGLCRHVCPVGLLQETLTHLTARRFRPWPGVPAIGVWLAFATWAGAAVGYPLFLWLDPFALFHGSLHAWRTPLTALGMIAGLGVPVLLAIEVLWPRLWCRRLCPLGGTQDAWAWGKRWTRQRWRGAAQTSPREDSAHPAPGGTRARRLFLAACAGGLGAWSVRRVRGAGEPPLRPPGALPEVAFTGACVRCGNCSRACPASIIQPDLAGGVTGFLAPHLSFENDYCRAGCQRCQLVCPSGAIRRQTLAAKTRALIGRAEVETEICLLALGRECNACLQRCPYDALTLYTEPGGFSAYPKVDTNRCNGCGACEAACPVAPVRAIRVRSLPPL